MRHSPRHHGSRASYAGTSGNGSGGLERSHFWLELVQTSSWSFSGMYRAGVYDSHATPHEGTSVGRGGRYFVRLIVAYKDRDMTVVCVNVWAWRVVLRHPLWRLCGCVPGRRGSLWVLESWWIVVGLVSYSTLCAGFLRLSYICNTMRRVIVWKSFVI